MNIPVPLGLAYRPDTHSCDWPDLLTGTVPLGIVPIGMVPLGIFSLV